MKAGLRKRQTLETLALKGPTNTYQLWKSIPEQDRGYKSAYQKSMSSLLKMGLVAVKQTEIWFGGRGKRTYQITPQGYVKVLENEAMWEHVGDIATANRELLPEYFELWDYFREVGIENIAIRLHRYAVEKLRHGLPTFPEKIYDHKPTLKEWLIRSSIFPEVGVLDKEEDEDWRMAIIANHRSYKIYLDTIDWMHQSHKTAAKSWLKAYNATMETREFVVQQTDAK